MYIGVYRNIGLDIHISYELGIAIRKITLAFTRKSAVKHA